MPHGGNDDLFKLNFIEICYVVHTHKKNKKPPQDQI